MTNLAGWVVLIMGGVLAFWYLLPQFLPARHPLNYFEGWWGIIAILLVIAFFVLPLCITMSFCAIM